MKVTISPFILAASALAVVADLPRHHPSVDVLSKFSPHFRCPYANDWVTKGPKQAAIDLGLVNFTGPNSRASSVRRRVQENPVGYCIYTNSWTGSPSCLEFRGDSWTEATMTERCGSETDSTVTFGEPCEVSSGLSGYCLVGGEGSIEATPMEGMECGMAQSTCQNFMSGTFSKTGGCLEDGGVAGLSEAIEGEQGGFPYTIETPSDPVSCAIAPGAIGAGHQAAYSTGYSTNCEGTPAEGSTYMWPMAWQAHVDAQNMAYGSDDIMYHSRGNVHYRLDKNWKRQDWYYQRGVQRSIGQAPCDPENVVNDLIEGPVLACRRDSDEYKTMIHRNSKMFFITWKNGTEVGSSDPNQIAECNFLDLQVVGNIRNDWYMDDRGDSTDVQYLGDQHVYCSGKPRLVKQWRKKDFANQYFVMSVQANVKEDGIHWPLILNVPGEGFGDDFLQIYENHTVLTDDDDYLFLLDEALEGIGGVCNEMETEGGAGPPTGQTVHIPSNLEVDPNAWFSNVYTFSPVWEPPAKEEGQSMNTGFSGMAVTQEDDLTVKSCFNPTTNTVQLEAEFLNIEMIGAELPWMALGYRETEECLMNPRGGGDAEIILLSSNEVHFTLLPSMARSFDEGAMASVYDNMSPLADKYGFSDVELYLPTEALSTTTTLQDIEEDSVLLRFKQRMTAVPEVMHLTYAIGSSPAIGYHKTRKCFKITDFPTCPAGSSEQQESVSTTDETKEPESSGRRTTVLGVFVAAVAAASLF